MRSEGSEGTGMPNRRTEAGDSDQNQVRFLYTTGAFWSCVPSGVQVESKKAAKRTRQRDNSQRRMLPAKPAPPFVELLGENETLSGAHPVEDNRECERS